MDSTSLGPIASLISLLTSVATLAAVLVGLGEFTKVSRSRKRASFWRESLADESLTHYEKKSIGVLYRSELSWSFVQSWRAAHLSSSIKQIKIYVFFAFAIPAMLSFEVTVGSEPLIFMAGTFAVFVSSGAIMGEAFSIHFASQLVRSLFAQGKTIPNPDSIPTIWNRLEGNSTRWKKLVVYLILTSPVMLIASLSYITCAGFISFFFNESNTTLFTIFTVALGISIPVLLQGYRELKLIFNNASLEERMKAHGIF